MANFVSKDSLENTSKGSLDSTMPPASLPSSKAYLGTIATSLFIQLCTVLQGILLARLLGPDGRGEFATVVLWPNIFAGVGILGVNMGIARLAGKGSSFHGLIKVAFWAGLVTGTLSALACTLALPHFIPLGKHDLLPAAYFYVLFVPLNHLGLNLRGIDQGHGNFTWLNGTRAILYPVYFCGLLLCWLFAVDKVFWALAALLAANASVVLLRLLPRLCSLWKPSPLIETGVLARESLPFIGASLISMLYTQMDKILLVWLLSPAELGWYLAAYAAAGTVNVLNSSLGIVQFSAAAQSQPGFGFSRLALVMRRGGVLSLLAGMVLGGLLHWLVPLVYGFEFQPALPIAYVLLPGLVLAGLGEIVNQALRGQGLPIAGVISKVLGLVLMGAVGYTLASSMGGIGIAIGYFAGELLAFTGVLLVAKSYYKDFTWAVLVPRGADVTFLWERVVLFKQTWTNRTD